MDVKKDRVLVVDDDPAIRTLVRMLLDRGGFQTDVACDGVEAIELIQRNDYDAVILDIMMPNLDGFGVIRHLENGKRDVLDRIVVLTASHIGTLSGAPVFSVMAKPFDIQALVREARRCVEATRSKTGEAAPEEAMTTLQRAG